MRCDLGKIAKEIISSEAQEIAKTIKSQIGMHTLMYVGANQFAYGTEGNKPYLTFKVKGTKMKVGGRIKILYDSGMDTYIFQALVVRGTDVKKIKDIDDVYAEDLSRIIKDTVG